LGLEISEQQLSLLIADLQTVYGYDFSGYTRASLHRRVNRLIAIDNFPSFAEFRYQLRSDPFYGKRFVEQVTVNVTEMFRDASFYQALRDKIFLQIAAKPFIRIWHAGCSTGEEVYSMAIMLHEANLLHKTIIYATDINTEVLEKARSGIFSLSAMRQYSENYIAAGGRNDFSAYYTAGYDRAIFQEFLKKKIVWSTHNLVSDSSFNEFQLILCRNVLIYFDKELQQRVLQLFDASLEHLGYLALGSKETIRFSDIHPRFRQIERQKIWKKTG
jgi:chemotaxis protein methyltransferase CheR